VTFRSLKAIRCRQRRAVDAAAVEAQKKRASRGVGDRSPPKFVTPVKVLLEEKMLQLRADSPRRRALSAAFIPSAIALILAGAASAPAQTPMIDPAPAAAPIAAVLTVPHWSKSDVRDLIAVIDDAAREGLTPADYGANELRTLFENGADGIALDTAATQAAQTLARDYLLGRVTDKSGQDWYIERSPYETLALQAGLAKAVADGKVKSWLTSLLPDNPQYGELRDQLARSEDSAERQRIRANMERWRWMPRRLGDDYVYVNVPAYRLSLVEDGNSVAQYDVVVGKKTTPTPQLVAEARSVVVNPWWNVPASIVREKGLSAGKRGGFVYADGGFRQAPGPRNALGRIKVDMPNDHAIYLHDTPSKGNFAAVSRTFSHGCIRVKDIDSFAARLMEVGANPSTQLDTALGTGKTTALRLAQSLPVYIVYFTAEVDGQGQLVAHEDPYGRDAQVLAGLDRARGTQFAALDLR
jgi:murein L,D-transpeptidase YcbB/YkuD